MEEEYEMISWRKHWHVLFPVVISIVASFAWWLQAFPNCTGVLKFWCGLATALPCVAAAIVYLQKQRHVGSTHNRIPMLVGSVFFAAIAVFAVSPKLQSLETELDRFRSLREADIESITFRYALGIQRFVTDSADIRDFLTHAKTAKLYSSSHERTREQFDLWINLKNGEVLAYRGGVPLTRPRDFRLSFSSRFGGGKLIVSDGLKWFHSHNRYKSGRR